MRCRKERSCDAERRESKSILSMDLGFRVHAEAEGRFGAQVSHRKEERLKRREKQKTRVNDWQTGSDFGFNLSSFLRLRKERCWSLWWWCFKQGGGVRRRRLWRDGGG